MDVSRWGRRRHRGGVGVTLSVALFIGLLWVGPSSYLKREALASPLTLLGDLLTSAHKAHPSLRPHQGERCERVGIRVHLTPRGAHQPKLLQAGERGELSDLRWLSEQFKEANRLFKALGVCFELTELLSHPKGDARVRTREQRSALGSRGQFQKGVVELFIVDRLDDVDIPDAYIRGVHWRHPDDRAHRRWIILSRIARPLVLAHELGHYFSLPHGKDPLSIMNKTPRETPPMSERGFTRAEHRKMRRAWRAMRGGQLRVIK